MYLSKIKIQNFKSIKNLELDLKTNSNGIKKDVLLGRFKEINGGKYGLPGYVAIFGRNAIGKTTLLEAISYLASFFNGTINNASISLLNNELNGGLSVSPFSRNVSHNEIIDKSRIIEGIQNGGEFRDRYIQINNSIIQNTFNKMANNVENDIKIELEFSFEDEKTEKFSFVQNGIIVNSTASKRYAQKIGEWLSSMLFEKSSLYMPDGNILITSSASHFTNDPSSTASRVLPLLRKSLSIQKVDKLLSLADPNAIKVSWVKNDAGQLFAEKIISNGGPIPIEALSSGTQKFLQLAERILAPIHSKKMKLVLIDEIELSLHKELVACLRMLMNDMFTIHGVQYIFTTHNPLAIKDGTSYKQIFSMEKVGDEHVLERLSKSLKPTQSIVNQYDKDIFAFYPDKEYARNVISSIVT